MYNLPFTNAGQVQGSRPYQEDALAYGHVGRDAWAVIADGMGGHRDGALAAQTAVNTIAAWVTETLPPQITPDAVRTWMLAGGQAAARAVARLASAHETSPPGTTLLWLWWSEGQGYLLHCGDSRAYAITSEATTPLTLDMTPPGMRVRNAGAPWSHQNTAPDAHILLSALGAGIEASFDFQTIPTSPDLTIALTSDGLNPLPLTDWSIFIRQLQPIEKILNTQPWADNASVILLWF